MSDIRFQKEVMSQLRDIKAMLALSLKTELNTIPVMEDVEVAITRKYEPEFIKILEHTLSFEGGYSNHPNDPGGATNFGITQKTYNKYLKEHKLDIKDVKEITHDEVSDIYYYDYWLRSRAHEVDSRFSALLFDSSVNCGVKNGSKFLQRTINSLSDEKIIVDGRIGPNTMSTAKIVKGNIVTVFNEHRLHYYNLIAKRNPKLKVFLNGWNKRLVMIEEWLKK